MTQIDEQAFEKAFRYCTGFAVKSLRVFTEAYESLKAPRTISAEQLDKAIEAYWQKHPYQEAGGAYSQQESMTRALATLNIQVEK